MNKHRHPDNSLGIPLGLPANLHLALVEELQHMGATYEDIAYANDTTLSPVQVLQVARLWNSLTPSQVDAWDEATTRENIRRSYAPCRN
jgi:hypothetical protein